MENKEDILDALNLFENKPASEIPPILDEYLCQIAKTGETLFPWPKLKPLLMKKLDKTMCKFFDEIPTDNLPPYPNVENVTFEEMRKRILDSVDIFTGVPFTIQRLCELVTNPKKHYKRTDKFLRGVEKNVIVVSTVDPFGRKVNSEAKPMVNGMETSPNNSYTDSGACNINTASPFAPPSWYTRATPPPNWSAKVDTEKTATENGIEETVVSDKEHVRNDDSKLESEDMETAEMKPESEQVELESMPTDDQDNVFLQDDHVADVTSVVTEPEDADQKPQEDTTPAAETEFKMEADTERTVEISTATTETAEDAAKTQDAAIESGTPETESTSDDSSKSESETESTEQVVSTEISEQVVPAEIDSSVSVEVESKVEVTAEVTTEPEDESSAADAVMQEESLPVEQSPDTVETPKQEVEKLSSSPDHPVPPCKRADDGDDSDAPPAKRLRESSPTPEITETDVNKTVETVVEAETEVTHLEETVSESSEVTSEPPQDSTPLPVSEESTEVKTSEVDQEMPASEPEPVVESEIIEEIKTEIVETSATDITEADKEEVETCSGPEAEAPVSSDTVATPVDSQTDSVQEPDSGSQSAMDESDSRDSADSVTSSEQSDASSSSTSVSMDQSEVAPSSDAATPPESEKVASPSSTVSSSDDRQEEAMDQD